MKLLNALNACNRMKETPVLLIRKMLKIYHIPVFFMKLKIKAQSARAVNQLVYIQS